MNQSHQWNDDYLVVRVSLAWVSVIELSSPVSLKYSPRAGGTIDK